MSPPSHDPLLDRLRAADPAQTLRGPASDRPRLTAELRRRAARRRRRATAGFALTAFTATLAAVIAPSGGPSYASIMARAAQAATPPPGAILVVDAVIDVNGIRTHQRSWQRATAGGTSVTLRVVATDSTDPREPAGSEYVSGSDAAGAPFTRRYDPRTGKTRVRNMLTSEGYMAGQMSAIVQRRASRHVVERTSVDGHDAYRLLSTIRGQAGGSRWQTEMLVDAKTFRLIAESEEARTPGSHRVYRMSVHVLSERKLPDTLQNRRFLKLRGPVR